MSIYRKIVVTDDKNSMIVSASQKKMKMKNKKIEFEVLLINY